MLTCVKTNPKELPRRKTPGPLRACMHEDLASLEHNWPDISHYPASPVPSFAWLAASRFAFSESADLRVLLAQRDGRTLAATVLTASGHGPIWRWVPLGQELGEPFDLAGENPQALHCVAHSLVRLGQPIEFQRMPANSPAIDAIRRAARSRALVLQTEAAPELAIQVDENWARPERHLSAAEYRQYRVAENEAERLGGTTTAIHSPNLCELPKLLDQVFQCEGECSGAKEAAIARRMSAMVFFRHFCETASTAGVLRICLLRIADRVVAAAIAVEQGSSLWLLRMACHPRYESCQPGKLMLREMLSYCAEAGVKCCGLWGERQPWMHAWPVTERACIRLSVYPITIPGMLAAVADGSKALVRRLQFGTSLAEQQ
jgi:CelD/BcsL family acetyltransferase involved in cellulose biosynthesis